MAIITGGILGGFSGKIGTVVGVSNGDTFYMRSRVRRRKTKSQVELNNQAKFKAVSITWNL